MTKQEKEKVFEWLIHNLEQHIHIYQFNWDGSEKYEIEEWEDSNDEIDIDWSGLKQQFMREL